MTSLATLPSRPALAPVNDGAGLAVTSTAGDTPGTLRPSWRSGWSALMVARVAQAVLGVLAGLVMWSVLPALFGWHATVVMSGSMRPRLQVGDVITSRPVQANQLRVGHVVLAADPDQAGRLRLHRIAVLDSDRVVLRGDANRRNDSSVVTRGAVEGVAVLRSPLVGSPGVWMHEDEVGRMLGTATGLVLVILASAVYRPAPVGESSDGGRVDGGRTRAGGSDRVTRSVRRGPSRGRRLGGSRRLPHAPDASPAVSKPAR